VALREDDTDDLVAAARVLTDYTYYAMVFDVIVDEDHRGAGVGEDLIAAVVTHPPLADLHLTLLAREGLIPFYESCGFEPQGEMDHPDGDPERLCFLAYRRGE
jgi:predicted GNAT family N-acyltransferase